MTKKVYVSDGYYGYSSWLKPLGWQNTTDRRKADLILFAGGSDIDPSLYKANENSIYSKKFKAPLYRRDKVEVDDYKFAQDHNIKMLGTCRGSQLLCALAGGSLIQNIDHPGGHYMSTFDHHLLIVNSLHHQMCNPFNLKEGEYHVLGWCNKGFSRYYEMYGQPDFKVPDNFVEPEVLFLPINNSLSWQFHPEMMSNKSVTLEWLRSMFEYFMADQLSSHISSTPEATKVQKEKLALSTVNEVSRVEDEYNFNDLF